MSERNGRTTSTIGHRALCRGLYAALPALGALAACHEAAVTPPAPSKASLGEDMFGVLCDRIGAQSLPEDLTGASYQGVCHRGVGGTFADRVDTRALAPVHMAAGPSAASQRGVARIEALARHRPELIVALDEAMPDKPHADPTGTCPTDPSTDTVHRQLRDMLRRVLSLTTDGTLPESTQTLAYVMDGLTGSGEAQAALAALGHRQGYRPADTALGAARALLGYPRVRPLLSSLLSVIGADASPFSARAGADPGGKALPVPGPGHDHLVKLNEVARAEVLSWEPPATRAPLVLGVDPMTGRASISRPRTGPEVLSNLLHVAAPVAENRPLGARLLVRRDTRGVALVAPLADGHLPAPFVDADGDGFADLDRTGAFVTTASVAPSPFFAVGAPDGPRDGVGRAVAAPGGDVLYHYLDTTQTLGAALIKDVHALIAQDEASGRQDLLQDLLDGLEPVLGDRDGAPTRTQHFDTGGAGVDVAFDGFRAESSALLDVAYAGAQVLGERSSLDTLQVLRTLSKDHTAEMARLVGALLDAKRIYDKYDAVPSLSKTSTLWDEILDVVVQMAKEPGLLEDVLKALAEDESAALGPIFAAHMQFKDRLSYDPSNLNGPVFDKSLGRVADMATPVDRSAPDTGWNRSVFQRSLQLLNDTYGVTLCNKKDAVVHGYGYFNGTRAPGDESAANLPTGGTFRECEFLKIDNLGLFFLDSIIGKSTLYFRYPLIYQATDVRLQEKSGGITGFWDAGDTTIFRPRPQFLTRQAFFDLKNDSPPESGGPNALTNRFLADMNGPNVGTSVCPERTIADPLLVSPDRRADGKIRGLRSCADGDWLAQRDADVLFAYEQLGFFKAISPTLKAVAAHNREDVFVNLMTTLHRHYQSASGTASECDSSAKRTSARYCAKDGLSRFEPMLAEIFASDLMPALTAVTKVVRDMTVTRCAAVDVTTGACTQTETVDGVRVLAEATRALVDPARAAAVGLKGRLGEVTARRNDGTTNPQVTPIYLLAEALDAVNASFDRDAAARGDGGARHAAWRRARARLVDQLFAVNGSGPGATFVNPAITAVTPALLDVVIAELAARCPTSFAPPYARCDWARDALPQDASDALTSPLTPGLLDVVDAIRANPTAQAELRKLLLYMTDPASPDEALTTTLASLHDLPQMLADEAHLAPVLKSLARAFESATPSDTTPRGGFMDAQLALLARLSGQALKDGAPDCSAQIDPFSVVPVVLRGLATPSASIGGRTPIEVLADTIADVNRIDPVRRDSLSPADYASLSSSVVDFLQNGQSGLEQLYEVVWRGTKNK